MYVLRVVLVMVYSLELVPHAQISYVYNALLLLQTVIYVQMAMGLIQHKIAMYASILIVPFAQLIIQTVHGV